MAPPSSSADIAVGGPTPSVSLGVASHAGRPIKVVAVTGAAGFLGQLARRELEAHGLQVIGIDLPQPRCQGGPTIPGESVADVSCVNRTCDLSTAPLPDDLFVGCDCVVHLAGDGRPSADFMQDILPSNIIATQQVFEASRRAGVRRVIFASSNHTQHGETMSNGYPGGLDLQRLDALGGPGSLRVSDPMSRVGPNSFYAVSKLCGEGLGYVYSRVFGAFEFVALRLGWCLYDNPTALRGTPCEDYLRSVWLSSRDFRGFLRAALHCDLSSSERRGFLVVYGVSRNGRGIFDLEDTVAAIGYDPVDDAETYFAKSEASAGSAGGSPPPRKCHRS